MKNDLEGQIKKLQEELRSRNWFELQNKLKECHEEVARTKTVVVELLQELKFDLAKHRDESNA